MTTRRRFLGGLVTTGALAPGVLRTRPAHAEPPPETTQIRLVRVPSICQAPQYAAEDLLRAEGFTDVQYVKKEGAVGIEEALASGEANINMHYGLRLVWRLDAGDPIVMLAGVHIGCVELFGSERVRSVRDLKGKRIAVSTSGFIQHQLIGIILGQVGIDHRKEVEWSMHPSREAINLLAEGKIDAFLGVPPEPQELRAKKIGRVLLDTAKDRPWSQYFCCMIGANRDFYRKHPVATKRAVRAILKGADLCSAEPERAARLIVDRGFTPSYDYARQTIQELPYRAWRELDPEEAVRFYALRMHEAGFIKSNPKKIIAEGTDWRIIRELKREMKA